LPASAGAALTATARRAVIEKRIEENCIFKVLGQKLSFDRLICEIGR
jgi:hypothetical protein